MAPHQSTSTMTGEPRHHEQQLIEAAQRDPAAFSALYTQHAGWLYAYASRRLPDAMAAEDIVADTFVLAMQYLPRYEWRGKPFAAWLFRIARNAVATYYRRSGGLPLEMAFPIADPNGVEPLPALLKRERFEELQAAIATLSPAQQAVVRLRYERDLRLADIATELDLSVGAVKQRLFRALTQLEIRLTSTRSAAPYQATALGDSLLV